jgi:hypothetical protein
MENQKTKEVQLSSVVETANPRAILADAKRFFKFSHPEADFKPVEKIFLLTKRLYDGRFPGYLACAVEYHDFAHSLAVFAAASRLMDGCELSGIRLEARQGIQILIAALLHDTGYIREESDNYGTGAQYTKVHVDRSAAFAMREAQALGLDDDAAARIARIILATELARPWADLSFECEEERTGGEILAAADLLGQMSDRAYLEKLLFLYFEFREAGIDGFDSVFDILKKTALFYESTKQRLDGPLGRVSRTAKAHFAARCGIDRDLYLEAISKQMAYLQQIISDDSLNFRTKLKRMDLAEIERRHA